MSNDNWVDISKMDTIICAGSLATWAVLWYLAATVLAL